MAFASGGDRGSAVGLPQEVETSKPVREASGPTILQLVPRLEEGGVERGAIEVAAAITRAGGRALVASQGGRMEGRLASVRAELIRLPMHSKSILTLRKNAHILTELIQSAGVDLVHARSRAPAWSGYWAAKRAGVPFVTTYHGAYNEGFPLKRSYNAIMARGRPTIAVSDFIADLIERRHHMSRQDIVAIPRGADLGIFSPERVSGERIAQLTAQWRLEDLERPIFILPGRLTRWKGQRVAIEAARRLKAERGADFLLLLVGGGRTDDFALELEAQIAKAKLQDCVLLTGSCQDMAAAYLMSRCVISASTDPEAFGRVAVEAQAMGRPVIATNHGGARETVASGETGILVPPRDANALASAMAEVLSLSPGALEQMGAAARARVEAHFTTQRMTDRTLDVYEDTLSRAFPRRSFRETA